MKPKILFYTIFAYCITICTIIGHAETIDGSRARNIAESFLRKNNGIPVVEDNIMVTRSLVEPELKLLRTIKTEQKKSALYIFNGDHSFVIVSAESEYGEILAYSYENRFAENGEEAPFAKEMVKYYTKQIEYLQENNTSLVSSVKSRELFFPSTTEFTNFGEGKLLVTAQFGQNGFFWNNDCPQINGERAYAGCGATALAIIMKYYNWPGQGKGRASVDVSGTTYSVTFSEQTYDWKSIPIESPSSSKWTDYAKKEVAKILYHAGVAVKMRYGYRESTSTTTDLGPALVNYFKYKAHQSSIYSAPYYHEWKKDYSDEAWIDMMKKEIDSNRPFIVWGAASKGGNHIFVCDGYDRNGFFHYNLGWSGTSNGYYSMNSVNGKYSVEIAIIGLEPDTRYSEELDPTPSPTPDPTPDADEHEYADLGLPSRTLWAKTNVGAKKEEEFGDYFAWGETSPKDVYTWATYKYCNGTENSINKYTQKSGTLEPSDDAATVQWGDDWRMPTMDELNELRSVCAWKYDKKNGVEGYFITGPNGNSIFLPTAGMRNNGYQSNISQGRYWSSSCSYSDVSYASYLLFDDERYKWFMVYRSYGHSVRPVYSKKLDIKVQSIKLSASYVWLDASSPYKFTVTVLPEDATDKGVYWSSGNESIVVVDQTGTISAVSAGETLITATALDGSGVTATCKVGVSQVSSIEAVNEETSVSASFGLDGVAVSEKKDGQFIIVKDKEGNYKKVILRKK